MDRWKVRECPDHGVMGGTTRCRTCFRDLGDEFEVVRATGARRSDPETSKLAALQNEPRRGSQRAAVLDAIRDAGPAGLTAREAAWATGIEGAWKRVSELRQGGHIVKIAERADPETKALGEVYAVPVRPPLP
jgi:hypothetical protein